MESGGGGEGKRRVSLHAPPAAGDAGRVAGPFSFCFPRCPLQPRGAEGVGAGMRRQQLSDSADAPSPPGPLPEAAGEAAGPAALPSGRPGGGRPAAGRRGGTVR